MKYRKGLPNYVLTVMMTLASKMNSQKTEIKLRFHFAVVLPFNAKDMLKIYSLRNKIRDDAEFIFIMKKSWYRIEKFKNKSFWWSCKITFT